jgi:hypothetical protein
MDGKMACKSPFSKPGRVKIGKKQQKYLFSCQITCGYLV